MIIAKFGGTSVGSAKRIENICDIVTNQRDKNPIVVVSAVSGITDALLSLPQSSPDISHQTLVHIHKTHLSLIKKLFKEKSEKEKVSAYVDKQLTVIAALTKKQKWTKQTIDHLVSYGEILSSYIVTQALIRRGIKSEQVLATDLIVTNDNFGSAEFLAEQTKKNVEKILLPILKKDIVPIVTGFIGATERGKTTTLGRGGSDYSASIIGYCLSVQEIQIWTDVDGVFSADPRLVKKAIPIKELSYKEASEMAFFGAKVLHPRTIKPAIQANIPVLVLNTFNPKNPGTRIIQKPEKPHPITAITFKRNITLINIYSTDMLLAKGFLSRIFTIFAKYNISIDLVSVSEVSVSVTLDNDEKGEEAVKDLQTFASVTIIKKLAIVSLIGEKIVESSKTMKHVFDIFNKKNIAVKMISLGATDINISFVIPTDQLEITVKLLHNTVLLKRNNL